MVYSTTPPPYQPVCSPTVPAYHPSIVAASSDRASHFRRLYDIYRLCAVRGDTIRAERAFSLLVRCREFDWPSNWRDGLGCVGLGKPDPEEEEGSDEEEREERRLDRERRRNDLKSRFLREVLAIHSRPAVRAHSQREPQAVLIELVLHLIATKQYSHALSEIDLYVPTQPYRDDAALHLYAGMICIYLAQEEVERAQSQSQAHSATGVASQPISGFSQTQSQSQRKRRANSSSSASSSSGSSSSSSSSSGHEVASTPKSKKNRRSNRYDPPTVFSYPVKGENIVALERESPHMCMEARRWFGRVIEIGEELLEQGAMEKEEEVVREARAWTELMDGKIPTLDATLLDPEARPYPFARHATNTTRRAVDDEWEVRRIRDAEDDNPHVEEEDHDGDEEDDGDMASLHDVTAQDDAGSRKRTVTFEDDDAVGEGSDEEEKEDNTGMQVD